MSEVTKESVKAFVAQKHPKHIVPINLDCWPEGVFVKLLYGKDYEVYADAFANNKSAYSSAAWIAACLCKENGELLFDANEKEDIKFLVNLPLTDFNNTVSKVMEHHGNTEEAQNDTVKN